MSMLGGVMESQRGSGNAEFKEPASFDSYLWADRPAADAYNGRIIRVTDVGQDAGSLFISDGTYWTPLGGHLVLDSRISLGLSTTSQSLVQLAGWSLFIPAGLFQKPGSYLRSTLIGQRIYGPTSVIFPTNTPAIKLGWSTAHGMTAVSVTEHYDTNGPNHLKGVGVVARVNDTQIYALPANDIAGNFARQDGDASFSLQTLSATTDTTLYAYASTNPSFADPAESTKINGLHVELITP